MGYVGIYSFGDGVTFPERQLDEDSQSLLGVESQQWGDETQLDTASVSGSRSGINRVKKKVVEILKNLEIIFLISVFKYMT